MLKDVMLRTRALGKTIEAFFQPFGSKMTHGLTELTSDQFKRAIKSLGLSWADDNSQLNLVFQGLDQDADRDYRGSLALEEIAFGVHDCVSKSLTDYENDYLEKTYQHLLSNNTFKQLRDILDYLNFNRDYSCSAAQFQQMFRETFKIAERDLEDYCVDILRQRYSIKVFRDAEQDKEKKGGKAQSGPRVFYYTMIYEFGFRNSGLHFGDMRFVKICESIFKAIQLKYLNSSPDK